MIARFLFLGSGASMGVPIIGCKCNVCLSKDSKQKRLRSSGLLQVGEKNILIDVGPDFREQALTHEINTIDAVFLTHAHYDHMGGIEDLRIFYYRQKKPIVCYLSPSTYRELEKKDHVTQFLDIRLLEEDFGAFSMGEISLNYFSFYQKKTLVTGFRLGSFAYITDISDYKDRLFSSLKGVKTLVLSACNLEKSSIHIGFFEALKFSKRVKAKTYFTHLSHEIDVESLRSFLGKDEEFGYDGLQLTIDG